MSGKFFVAKIGDRVELYDLSWTRLILSNGEEAEVHRENLSDRTWKVTSTSFRLAEEESIVEYCISEEIPLCNDTVLIDRHGNLLFTRNHSTWIRPIPQVRAKVVVGDWQFRTFAQSLIDAGVEFSCVYKPKEKRYYCSW